MLLPVVLCTVESTAIGLLLRRSVDPSIDIDRFFRARAYVGGGSHQQQQKEQKLENRMPFGEVMYRCNAHYCFSSVFRNRVVGLVITLALMQLFLFSFYLNGLHSQVGLAQTTVTGFSSELPLVIPAPPPPAPAADGRHEPPSPAAAGQEAEWTANQLASKTRLAAKKALDHLMANNKPAVDAVVAMAAKKFSASVDSAAPPVDPMTKMGLNLLASAFSNGQTDKSKSQYANLAQMGLQLLSNNLDLGNNKNNTRKNNDNSGMLNIATQIMLQNSKMDPLIAKSALGFLKNAMGNQKIDPKLMLNLAAKMMPQQQQSAGQRASGDFGLNLLSQVLSNGQVASLLSGAMGQAANPNSANSAEQSSTIYRNYLKLTSKNLPALKSKFKLPEPFLGRNKIVVDLDFKYPIQEADFCLSNITSLVVVISHVGHAEERNAARDTWISDFRQLDKGVKVLFFVGHSTNTTAESAVMEESAKFHDIIQTNVQEPIENAVYKTLASLVWIHKHCANVKHILRIDDDVYVSAKTILGTLFHLFLF